MISQGSSPTLEERARIIRAHVIRMVYAAQSGHIGPSLSIADLLAVLYFQVMRIDPRNPRWPERDRFFLSKGHGCSAWYAALAERGYFP
ncbi:MAG: transketolase, partial [candidate division NC10 bacterium]|nr:transketolase [candidate division NC10 bacterium]